MLAHHLRLRSSFPLSFTKAPQEDPDAMAPRARATRALLESLADKPPTSQKDFKTSLALLVHQFEERVSSDDCSSISSMIVSLLDMKRDLQTQVDSLAQKLAKDHQPGQDEHPRQRQSHMVLHRVFCDKADHCHDRRVYEDEPTLSDCDASGGSDEILRGNRPIFNVKTYLSKDSALDFVIFKEYTCVAKEYPPESVHGSWTNPVALISASSERMCIVSPDLKKALKEVSHAKLSDEKDIKMNSAPNEMDAPYTFLFHHYQELLLAARTDESLQPLMEFIEANYKTEYEDASILFGQRLVESSHIGKLFPLNTIVVEREKNPILNRAAMLTESVLTETGVLYLSGWCWQYKGIALSRAEWKGSLSIQANEKVEFEDLAIVPFNFASGWEKDNLERRGVMFSSMRGPTYLSYSCWDPIRRHLYDEERFMIDTPKYTQINTRKGLKNNPDYIHPEGPPNSDRRTSNKSQHDSWPMSIDPSSTEISSKMAPLLPATVMGFEMRTRKWVELNVGHLHILHWNKIAFATMILARVQKGLLWSLFESIAEIVEKPLYHVTASDIGTDPGSVESNAETVLATAKSWDCITLFDEAEDFLEFRAGENLDQRNAMSTFLRVAEYHDGITILTTKHDIPRFDEALKSRIHISLHFEAFTAESRRDMWDSLIDSIDAGDKEYINASELWKKVKELATYDMDGRQIRNSFITSLQLAKYRGVRMDSQIVREILRTSCYPQDERGIAD
ncbi:hypothetical protein HYFRA_00011275 [Hymenoscyphus fraxineus]|uniref:AAA+ ATPase lid domain-containing protein n=1 Tax=Hymenoscyphus fraxineus TaxID=746836 RepID=A0A9N9KYV6_9HELO|nr:hypothetical protein HYFRA_00011275 [Hymenoscyphus fraxineus]